jgi:hypothetical protein
MSLALVACGAAEPTATAVPPSSTPVPPTETPVPPTATVIPSPTPEPELDFEGTVVTFDGTNCTVNDLQELPVGDHPFLLIDQTDNNVTLWVARIAEDDKTYQDLLDDQEAPGVWKRKPDWVKYDQEVEKDYLDAGRAWTYRLDVEGVHFVYVGNYDPPTLWYCAPFDVVAAP